MEESGSEDGGGDASDDDAPRSAISGKKIRMKLERTKEQKKRDKNRKTLLEFLNSTM